MILVFLTFQFEEIIPLSSGLKYSLLFYWRNNFKSVNFIDMVSVIGCSNDKWTSLKLRLKVRILMSNTDCHFITPDETFCKILSVRPIIIHIQIFSFTFAYFAFNRNWMCFPAQRSISLISHWTTFWYWHSQVSWIPLQLSQSVRWFIYSQRPTWLHGQPSYYQGG